MPTLALWAARGAWCVSARHANGSWYNTQEDLYVLVALSNYAKTRAGKGATVRIKRGDDAGHLARRYPPELEAISYHLGELKKEAASGHACGNVEIDNPEDAAELGRRS